MSGEAGGEESIPRPRQSAVMELLGRWRVVLVLEVLLVELTILFLATSVPIDVTTRQALQSEAKSLSRSTSGLSPPDMFLFIFTHNVVVAFGEMVPVLGGFLWVISIYATGQVIQLVALSQGAPGLLYGFLILFFPFAIVELSAYAVAVTSGAMLIVAWRRRRLRAEAKVLVLEAGIVAALLLSAAAMETVTIVDPTLGLFLWMPTGTILTVLAWITRRPGRRV